MPSSIQFHRLLVQATARQVIWQGRRNRSWGIDEGHPLLIYIINLRMMRIHHRYCQVEQSLVSEL